MLNLITLLNKKTFQKCVDGSPSTAGDVVVDLIRRSVSFLGVRGRSGQLFVVPEEGQMRPDLVAHSFYSDTKYSDAILKYNGVSNPFSLDQGDILRIPNHDTMAKFTTPPKTPDPGAARKKKSNVVFTPKSKKDQARVNFLATRPGATAPPVPPNIALDKGVKLANGKIVFGADVTSIKKEDCPEPISRTKLKESLIKNKLSS